MNKPQNTNAAPVTIGKENPAAVVLGDINEDDFSPVAVDPAPVTQQSEADGNGESHTYEVDADAQPEADSAEQEAAETELDVALDVEAANTDLETAAQDQAETQAHIEQFVEGNLQAPVDGFDEQALVEDEELEDYVKKAFASTEEQAEVAQTASGDIMYHTDNVGMVYLTLALASLGIRVRGVVAKNFNNVFIEGSVSEATISLQARLPKALFSSEKPFIRSLEAMVKNLTSEDGHNFNLALLVAPNDKRMKKVTDLATAYDQGQVVDLVDHLAAGNDINELLGYDLQVLVSSNGHSSLTFKGIGDANIPNFCYLENTLDVIAPSLSTVAQYVEFLSKSGVPVSLDPHGVYYAYPEYREITVIDADSDDNLGLNIEVAVFMERYRFNLMQLGKTLRGDLKINPLFLGNKLLDRANDLGEIQVNRYDLCSVSLLENSRSNWSFMGSTEFDMSIEFHHSLNIDAPIADEEDDEEDDEE